MKRIVYPVKPLMLLMILLLAGSVVLPALSQPFSEPTAVTARLIADVDAIAPGQSFTLGLHLELEGDWHVYWENPEGPGFPVSVQQWSAPAGFEFGEIMWPAPKLFEFESLSQFGYGDQVTLLFEVTAPDNLEPGSTITISNLAEWLACEEQCIPGEAEVSLSLPVRAEPGKTSEQAQLIEAARGDVASVPFGWEVQAQARDGGYQLILTAPNDLSEDVLEELYFFSREQYAVDPAAPQPAKTEGRTLTIDLTQRTKDGFGFDIERDAPVSRLDGILSTKAAFIGDDGGQTRALEINTEIQGTVQIDTGPRSGNISEDADASSAASGSGANSNDNKAANNEVLGLWLTLGAAFIGGLILNLMPCVFPVLSIKILGFVKQAGENPAMVRRHGYAFGVGVLISFWALAGLMLIIKQAAISAGTGDAVSWGFQMQNPAFILAMTVLVFLIGLNLAGVFEIGVGLTGLGQKATAGTDGYTKSFLTGALATLIATPCTGPFMGAALGATLNMPPWQAMIVFTSLGIGMALPYVLLSCFPALLGYLPKPGPWMESFKQAMSFPMFATMGWLVYIYAGLVDESLVLHLGFGLSAIGAAAWAYGRWSTPIHNQRTRWIGRGIAVILAVGGLMWVQARTWSIQQAEAEAAAARASGEYVLEWKDYSPELIENLRAEGRPVLVDFTAKWCGICIVNKGTSLRGVEDTEQIYRENNVALVVADFTKRSPELTRELNAFGRDGVPLYLVYPANGGEPEILPNTLTPDIVVQAIKRATNEPNQQAAN